MPTAPLALIAELTHRCPLRCVYCSNPLELRARSEELSTETWVRAFEEAAQLCTLLRPCAEGGRSAAHLGNPIGVYSQPGCAPAESGPLGRNHLVRRKVTPAPHRDCPRSVLRLGAKEPRGPAAHARSSARIGRCRGTRERKAERDQDRLCDAGLLRNIPQTLHGRLGPPAHGCRSFRQSPAVPRRRRDPRSEIRKREGKVAALDLGRVFVIPAIPRRRLDAGAMPHLRAAHPGLRGLPLPGFPGHGRCSRYRPRLLAFTPPPPD